MKEQTIDLASKLWAEGFSISQIARKVGSTTGTIAGISRRDRMRFPARRHDPGTNHAGRVMAFKSRLDRQNKIIELWASGLSQTEICAKIGCSPATVRRLRELYPEKFQAHDGAKQARESRDERRYGDARSLQVPGTEPIPLTRCGPFRCKLPLTDLNEPAVADVLCCGQPVLSGTSACAAHYRILYRPKRELEEA